MDPRIDRRQAVLGGLGAAMLPAMAQAAADPLSGAALYADVKAYAGLGEHRTGTAGDNATTAWLERALKAAGYAVERQGFDYPVFDLVRSDMSLGGRTIEGFPYWTPGTTPAAGVTAPLSLSGGPGTIRLVDLPIGSGVGLDAPPPKPILDAVATRPLAVVAITESALGLMSVLNRNPKAPPWPTPVLLVAGAEAAALKAAAASGQTATVRLTGTTTIRTAENLIGRRARPGKHLVVSTPKSGWLHCAGERGSGIAIWLGLARWLAATTDHNVTVVAVSGHEFDGYGGDRFTEHLAPKPADTKLWVAIGANVASYDFARVDGKIVRQAGPQSPRVLGCSGSLRGAAARAFAGQRDYEKPLDLDGQTAPGELGHFRALGYRPLVGLVASHPLHHTRLDLPDVTDGAMLEPVARGLAAVISGPV
jgi:hypothetical protein